MDKVKINELPELSSPSATTYIPVVSGSLNETKKISYTNAVSSLAQKSNPVFSGGISIDTSSQMTMNGNGGIDLPIDSTIDGDGLVPSSQLISSISSVNSAISSKMNNISVKTGKDAVVEISNGDVINHLYIINSDIVFYLRDIYSSGIGSSVTVKGIGNRNISVATGAGIYENIDSINVEVDTGTPYSLSGTNPSKTFIKISSTDWVSI